MSLAFARAAVGIGDASERPARRTPRRAQDDPAVVAAKLNHMGFVAWRRLRLDSRRTGKSTTRGAPTARSTIMKLEAETLDLVKLEREHD